MMHTTNSMMVMAVISALRSQANNLREQKLRWMEKLKLDPVRYEKYLARMRRANSAAHKESMNDPESASKRRARKTRNARARNKQINANPELRAKLLQRRSELAKARYLVNKSSPKYIEQKKQQALRYTKGAKGKAASSRRHQRLWNESVPYKITFNCRRRIREAIAGNDKHGNLYELVGCSMEELKLHLEKQFKDGMCWANYGRGKGKWSIDHISPCAAFDMSCPEQQKKAFHYSNLQPLWYEQNSSKGSLVGGVRLRYLKPGGRSAPASNGWGFLI